MDIKKYENTELFEFAWNYCLSDAKKESVIIDFELHNEIKIGNAAKFVVNNYSERFFLSSRTIERRWSRLKRLFK